MNDTALVTIDPTLKADERFVSLRGPADLGRHRG